MSKAYSEDRFPSPRIPPKLKNTARTPPVHEKLPRMTKEPTFDEDRERSATYGVHQQDEQN